VPFIPFSRIWFEIGEFGWHNNALEMTKTELQTALAAATNTDKRTAGVFLETLMSAPSPRLV